MAKLETRGLHFSYTAEKKVLNGIDLILEGPPTAIVGQNGAGKTTFVKVLKGLLRPSKGSVYFNGEDIKDQTVAQLSRHIGLIFQNPNDQIFKNRVLDEVMFGPSNIGASRDDARDQAMAALERLGLEDEADANPYDLSLSERKLIAVASILAMDPDVLIFDEPTMGQDFEGKDLLKQIIREEHARGKLILCILHDMDFAADVFDRTIVFNQGNVLLDGPTREVFSQKDILESAFLEQPSPTQIARVLGLDGCYLTDAELIAALKN
ncbi:energy-coupling factor ABC transporter ATP-binding protein [Atopococcus tabaci]|uniref:energy-coupling factor ABC transporter ATP-binding protein n=1 Tax=Atopococcus tabaci TaxID=269774 RepID=UPI000408475E|nr:ABC transporter ATP-binding protein [Atopococcus tabaci]